MVDKAGIEIYHRTLGRTHGICYFTPLIRFSPQRDPSGTPATMGPTHVPSFPGVQAARLRVKSSEPALGHHSGFPHPCSETSPRIFKTRNRKRKILAPAARPCSQSKRHRKIPFRHTPSSGSDKGIGYRQIHLQATDSQLLGTEEAWLGATYFLTTCDGNIQSSKVSPLEAGGGI